MTGPLSIKALRRRADRSVRRASASARCLPDFLLIGVMKAGTTSLFDQLLKAPDVRAPQRKEVHYFDTTTAARADEYRQFFPVAASSRTWVTGEATPITFHVPSAPAQVSAVVPDARLVLLLRNPVDRAFSHFHHSRRLGDEPITDFREALAAEDDRAARAFEAEHWVEDWTRPARTWAYRRRSCYAPGLRRWLEHFPRERLLVLRTDDLGADPASTVGQVREHLGLPAAGATPSDGPRRNDHPHDRLSPVDRSEIGAMFRQDVAETEEILGRSLGWRL